MKTLKGIFTTSLVLLVFCSFVGINEDIAAAFKAGNAFKVAKFFEKTVDITILEESDLLSKLEAEQLLYKFFYDHKPSDYKVLHQGESKNGLTYTIGKLTTNNGNFRVTIYISKSDQSEHIQQLIIDTE